jgi:hypothetical protein
VCMLVHAPFGSILAPFPIRARCTRARRRHPLGPTPGRWHAHPVAAIRSSSVASSCCRTEERTARLGSADCPGRDRPCFRVSRPSRGALLGSRRHGDGGGPDLPPRWRRRGGGRAAARRRRATACRYRRHAAAVAWRPNASGGGRRRRRCPIRPGMVRGRSGHGRPGRGGGGGGGEAVRRTSAPTCCAPSTLTRARRDGAGTPWWPARVPESSSSTRERRLRQRSSRSISSRAGISRSSSSRAGIRRAGISRSKSSSSSVQGSSGGARVSRMRRSTSPPLTTTATCRVASRQARMPGLKGPICGTFEGAGDSRAADLLVCAWQWRTGRLAGSPKRSRPPDPQAPPTARRLR